jgi:hypothetical protein
MKGKRIEAEYIQIRLMEKRIQADGESRGNNE